MPIGGYRRSRRSRYGRGWVIGFLGIATVGLVACGSSGATAGPSSTSASHTTAAGSGSTGTTTGSGGPPSGLDLAKLGSLTDYSATMTDNGTTLSYSAHSPTDWEFGTGSTPILHVDGFSYTKSVNAQGQPVWYKTADNPGAYQHTAYPGAVAQFIGFTKATGVTVVRGAPCSAAGVAGHAWSVRSPSNSTLTEQETACVADQSGALLSLGTGASGSAVPSSGFSYSVTVTSIGNVATIPVPSPVQAG